MVSEARSLVAILLAFVAPFIYYSANNQPLKIVPVIEDGPPAIQRLQAYLRVRTDHAKPDYEAAILILNATVTTLLPGATSTAHAFAPGKPLLLVRIPGHRSDLPAVLLNSHMDVVPVESEKWTIDPFSAEVVMRRGESRVYARGTQDMKSIGMQYIEAVAELMSRGWQPLRTVYLSFVPEEEVGGKDGMGLFVQSQLFTSLNIGVAMDEGAPSPGEAFNVFYGERQTWWLQISVVGPPGHGATLPEAERTAAAILHRIAARALAYRHVQHARLEAGVDIGDIVNVNLAFLEAGTADSRIPGGYAMNMIPSRARAGFDIRVPPSVREADMDAEIESWLTCPNGKRCPGVSMEWVNKVNIPVTTSRDPSENPYITPFAAAMREAGIDNSLRHGIFFAATDSRYLRDVGIPCFGFSPIHKTPNLMHKHDEYITVDGYLRGIEIYQSIVKNLADFDPSINDTQVDPAQLPRCLPKCTPHPQSADSIEDASFKYDL